MTEKQIIKKKSDILELLPKHNYHIGKVCSLVKISRRTYYNWQDSDIDFKENIEEVFEYDLDDAEAKLKLLRQGIPEFKEDENGVKKFVGWKVRPSLSAIRFFLQSKGQERGYGNTLEIKSTDLSQKTDAELDAIEKALINKINEQEGKIGKD